MDLCVRFVVSHCPLVGMTSLEDWDALPLTCEEPIHRWSLAVGHAAGTTNTALQTSHPVEQSYKRCSATTCRSLSLVWSWL
jgi:hypothetical protein